MRILLKFPTRSRPQKALDTLKKYIRLANHPEQMGMVVSCDTDDTSMTRNILQEEFRRAMKPLEWSKLCFSPNKSKIEACNANMDEVDYPWDIVVLVSDDMIPQIKGYDDVIRNYMLASFPSTDGILWFNDGHQGNKLNTLCVFGRKMYDSFGYIYHPAYKSLFCDTELTDLCKTSLNSKCVYISQCIIRHEHPGTGFAQNMDALYAVNQRFWSQDMYTYISRKQYDYDWTVLIPTILGREDSLQSLLKSIHEKVGRIAPSLRMEIKVDYDNRETSIGNKRQRLLQGARGKYMSFVDDDDDITDAYIEDLLACIRGGHHVMRLRGNILPYTFTHSIEVKLSEPMARDNTFVRPPNHLNPMMTDVAKLIHFQDAVRGEDLDWTLRLAKAGFLTNEYRSDLSRIHYIYNLGERSITNLVYDHQKNMTFDAMLSAVYTPPPPAPEKTSGLRWGPRGFVSK
jgi:hypothetical protein